MKYVISELDSKHPKPYSYVWFTSTETYPNNMNIKVFYAAARLKTTIDLEMIMWLTLNLKFDIRSEFTTPKNPGNNSLFIAQK